MHPHQSDISSRVGEGGRERGFGKALWLKQAARERERMEREWRWERERERGMSLESQQSGAEDEGGRKPAQRQPSNKRDTGRWPHNRSPRAIPRGARGREGEDMRGGERVESSGCSRGLQLEEPVLLGESSGCSRRDGSSREGRGSKGGGGRVGGRGEVRQGREEGSGDSDRSRGFKSFADYLQDEVCAIV